MHDCLEHRTVLGGEVQKRRAFATFQFDNVHQVTRREAPTCEQRPPVGLRHFRERIVIRERLRDLAMHRQASRCLIRCMIAEGDGSNSYRIRCADHRCIRLPPGIRATRMAWQARL